MKSRNYSESEKFAAVERFLVGGESVATIAADTGISRSTLYAWIKSAQIEPGMLEFTRKKFSDAGSKGQTSGRNRGNFTNRKLYRQRTSQ